MQRSSKKTVHSLQTPCNGEHWICTERHWHCLPPVLPLFFFLVLLSCANGSGAHAQVDIPLDQPRRWEILNYASIPANKVIFSPQGMLIEIKSSASPLVYPLDAGSYASLAFDIDVQGSLNLPKGKQGEKGYDDFLFRVGVVYEGKQTLKFMQRRFAASWIKRLFSLAPGDSGVDHIAFYNVYSDNKLAEQFRVHPLSDLVHEHFVSALDAEGNATATVTLDKNKRVLALWISADGDDTASNFSLRINRISLQQE